MENLKSRDTVIGVDDRNCAKLQKLREGILGMPAVFQVDHGVAGHQNLGCHLIIFSEKFLVDHHQSRLSDGCAGLLHGDALRLLLKPGCLPAHADGSGCDQNHILTPVMQI